MRLAKMWFLFLLLVRLLGVDGYARGTILLDKLIKDYDRNILPMSQHGEPIVPVVVNVSLTFENLWGVSDREKTYDADVYLGQAWTDPRLAWDPARYGNLTELMITEEDDIKRIWTPDTFWYHLNFFIKRKHIQAYLRLGYDGNVYMSQQAVMNIRCVMDLRKFPFDSQDCKLVFGSYARPKNILDYSWGIGNRANRRISGNPVTHVPKFIKGEMALADTPSAICATSGIWQVDGGPEYRQMKVSVHMKRKYMRYIWTSYLPSFAVAFIAYCSYWMGPYSSPARVSLVVVSSLTSSALLNSAKSYMVSPYITALELYVLIHFILVLLALVEYTVVNFLLSYAFELNPPHSAPGMKARQRKAEKRLMALRDLRDNVTWPNDRQRQRNHMRELQQHRMLEGTPPQSQSGSFSDTGEVTNSFSQAEMSDFFYATDVACRGKVSIEDTKKASCLLGLEEVPPEALQAWFVDVASDHKTADAGTNLNFQEFSEFLTQVIPMGSPEGLPRGVHVEVAKQPYKIRFGRVVTYYLSDDPLILDRWMRSWGVLLEFSWQFFYWFVWLSDWEWFDRLIGITINIPPEESCVI